MRIQRYTLQGYGEIVRRDSGRPAPPRGQFRGFGGEWEDWCDRNYWTPENNEMCKECVRPLGFCTLPAPYTQAGRAARKVYWRTKGRDFPLTTDLERLGPPPGETPDNGGVVTIPEVDGDSWFDQNKTTVIAVGAAGLIGLALLMRGKGRRGGFMGLGSSPRRKRRSKRRS